LRICCRDRMLRFFVIPLTSGNLSRGWGLESPPLFFRAVGLSLIKQSAYRIGIAPPEKPNPVRVSGRRIAVRKRRPPTGGLIA
jgi:hypothetical protein